MTVKLTEISLLPRHVVVSLQLPVEHSVDNNLSLLSVQPPNLYPTGCMRQRCLQRRSPGGRVNNKIAEKHLGISVLSSGFRLTEGLNLSDETEETITAVAALKRGRNKKKKKKK